MTPDPVPTCQKCGIIEPFRCESRLSNHLTLDLCPGCQASLTAVTRRWLAASTDDERTSFDWVDPRGLPQGSLHIDARGALVIDVDDPFYSGTLDRQKSVTLAQALLALDPP